MFFPFSRIVPEDVYKRQVIVHDRDAHGDCMEITRGYPGVTGVYHCYAGSVEMARELLKLGYYLCLLYTSRCV